MGGSPLRCKLLGSIHALYRPLCGLENSLRFDLGLTPPGFMLAPASQAKAVALTKSRPKLYCLRLLRRLVQASLMTLHDAEPSGHSPAN
jgi:hypothetical protein